MHDEIRWLTAGAAPGTSKMHIVIDEDHEKKAFNSDDDERTFWASWRSDTSSHRPRVDCEKNFVLAGHSFGGATVVSADYARQADCR